MAKLTIEFDRLSRFLAGEKFALEPTCSTSLSLGKIICGLSLDFLSALVARESPFDVPGVLLNDCTLPRSFFKGANFGCEVTLGLRMC